MLNLRNNSRILILTILIIGFFVYANSLPNGFVWDDEEQIVKNSVIRSWANLPLIFSSSTFYAGGAGLLGGFYRPLVTFSYFLNYHLWGLNPLGFRIFQIFFHLLNLILIFLILRRIFDEQHIKYSERISFLATLFFAVHPANVESVVYLASIGEVLYLFLGLLAIWFFLSGVNLETRDVKNSFLFLSFIFIFLGLLAKESAATFLFILFLYLLIFVRPRFRVYKKYFLGAGITLGFYSLLRFLVAKIPAVSKHYSPISQASFLEKLKTIPYEIFSYLRIIFSPKDLAVSQQFVVYSVKDFKFWGCFIFLIIILALAIFLTWKKKSKISAFFFLWFFGTLFPTLNIFPFEMTIAERWLYLPLIGALAFLSYLLFQLKEKLPKSGQNILIVFLFLIILTLGIRTMIRNTNWKNGLSLFSHDIQYSKNSFDLANNCGVELFRIGKIAEAKIHFQQSIRLQDKWPYSHNNLGVVYEREDEFEKALEEYKKAVSISDYYLAYENAGKILLKMQRYEEAKEFLSNAISKFPQNSILKLHLALVYLKENDIQKATFLLVSALKEDPQNLQAKQILEIIQRGIKIDFQ